jgi:hypothetical protein
MNFLVTPLTPTIGDRCKIGVAIDLSDLDWAFHHYIRLGDVMVLHMNLTSVFFGAH